MRWLVVWAVLFVAYPSGPRAEMAGCSKVLFSAHPEYPPFHWRQGNVIVGASVDITLRIFAEMGLLAEPRYVGPWPRVLKNAEHGEIDLIVALKDTPERREYLDFTSAPIFANPMAVFVRADASWVFSQWEDLIGRRGGVNSGDRYGGGFDEFLSRHLTVEGSDNLDSNFKKLLAGRTDYFITGLHTGRAYLLANGLDAQVRAMAEPVTSGDIFNGFSRNSPCRALVAHFNRRLGEMWADGTIQAALEDNLHKWRAGR